MYQRHIYKIQLSIDNKQRIIIQLPRRIFMNFNNKKLIKFLLVISFFYSNAVYSRHSLPELLNVNNYDEVKGLFRLPANELKEKVNFILQRSIKLEKKKFKNTDLWYQNTPEADAETEEYGIEYPVHIEKYDMKRSKKLKAITIGDLHGNFYALNRIIEDLIERRIVSKDLKVARGYKIIGLGDYIDRGNSSLENIFMFMLLKTLNPENIVILRGNHENMYVFSEEEYGFDKELETKLNENPFDINNIDKNSLSYKFNYYFNLLPRAYFIKAPNNKLFQFNHACSCSLLEEQEFLSSNKALSKIIVSKGTELTWNDYMIESLVGTIDFSYKGVGKIRNYLELLREMKNLKINAKFGGHQHDLAKGFHDANDYSAGFIRLAARSSVKTPSIFVLISGSMDSINYYYYPSYLELEISDPNWNVSGYVGSEEQGFNKIKFRDINFIR